jgi:hypothetical protein
MASELFLSTTTGRNTYAVFRCGTDKRGVDEGGNIGRFWNASVMAWEPFDASNWGVYAYPLTELGASGFYEADFPTITPPEKAVEVYYFNQAGAAAAQSDTKLLGARFEFIDEWIATGALEV